MVFASPTFVLAFLPVMLILHALCPIRARNGLLLAASLLFYAWGEVEAFLLLVVATALNFAVVRRLQRWPRLLLPAIALNLAPLFWFKYLGFASESITSALHFLDVDVDVSLVAPALPLGISFYTFQSISLLVDVARRPQLARHGLLDVALYTTFFPGMVAGPIERYGDIEPQLRGRGVSVDDVLEGLLLFVRGLARKLLLANVLAGPVDEMFALPPEHLTTSAAWLAIACYAAQIYHDFGGYSDMALGLARMFGFRYPQNFDRPYLATSITSFWRRWHISLSTWFRDYVYVPLGGNRRGRARTALHLVLVFLLCGLWHGAAWTFVLWGAWHGAGLVVERVGLARVLDRAPAGFGWLFTTAWVWTGWVFFRAEDVPQALAVLRALAGFAGPAAPGGVPWVAGTASWLSPHLALTLAVAWASAWMPPRSVAWASAALSAHPVVLQSTRGLLLLCGLALCIAALAALSHNPFIYYRF